MPRRQSYLCSSTIEHAPSGLRKVAGEEISLEELQAAGQSDEDIERLIADGALEGEFDGATVEEAELRAAAAKANS